MLNIILKERAVYNRQVIKIAQAQMKAFPADSINHTIAKDNLTGARAVLAELITIEGMFQQSKYLDI